MGIISFTLRRLLVLLMTLLVVSVMSFMLPYMSEGDPARSILRSRVADLALDEDAVEVLKIKYGLDRPLPADTGIKRPVTT